MTYPSEFFEQLEQFTALWVREYLGSYDPESPWHSEPWGHGQPKGAIIHYTADPDPVRVMRWFLLREHNARVSAHAIVLPGWTEETRKLAAGFSEIEKLSAPVLQAVGPDKEAWHATWTNGWAYGIENVNPGRLQCRRGQFFWWRPRNGSAADWTSTWDISCGEPIPLVGQWWAPYPRPQVAANVELLRWVHDYFDGCFVDRSRILGHEHVQGNKWDPGPAYPIHAVRRALFDHQYQEINEHAVDLMHGQTWRDALLQSWYETLNPNKAWADFSTDVNERQTARMTWDDWGIIMLILDLLGYSTADNNQSIRYFQASAGVVVDGIVGPITWRALKERLRALGYIK
jgi:hypothetical protein